MEILSLEEGHIIKDIRNHFRLTKNKIIPELKI